MNKTELIEAIAKKTGGTKRDAELALNATLDVIARALKKGDKVQLIGFGSFEARPRAARTARNPKTGEQIKIKATRVPVFKAGKALKEHIA